MSDVVIAADNLSKRYRIGDKQASYGTLRDSLSGLVAGFFHRRNDVEKLNIWALNDVSFEVNQGEVVGIIGRNGAGKSTLLKILSRITKPTSGSAQVRGRVGSLLEVGTGFHPELTGRENIYLNGAVLGMKRAEIGKKFDEIVDFGEIEEFLDTPIKHYSSGMYMRLAFAIASHLDPEILLIDEVLAVGDAAFQRKCLGKMDDISGEGRTVVFVSHDLAMIRTLCDVVMLLHKGKLENIGKPSEIIRSYLDKDEGRAINPGSVKFPHEYGKKAQILAASLRDSLGDISSEFDVFEKIEVRVNYVVYKPIEGIAVNLVVKRNSEILFVSFDSDDNPELLQKREAGCYSAAVWLPTPLKSGHYSIDLSLGRLNVGGVDVREDALSFDIAERSFDTSMRSYSSSRPGVMAAHLVWSTKRDR